MVASMTNHRDAKQREFESSSLEHPTMCEYSREKMSSWIFAHLLITSHNRETSSRGVLMSDKMWQVGNSSSRHKTIHPTAFKYIALAVERGSARKVGQHNRERKWKLLTRKKSVFDAKPHIAQQQVIVSSRASEWMNLHAHKKNEKFLFPASPLPSHNNNNRNRRRSSSNFLLIKIQSIFTMTRCDLSNCRLVWASVVVAARK